MLHATVPLIHSLIQTTVLVTGSLISIGRRNAPALFNLAWQDSFMHDGAAHNLQAQSIAPFTSVTEMGTTLQNVLTALNSSPLYLELFKKTFDTTPSIPRALEALEAFQLNLISSESKYRSGHFRRPRVYSSGI